MKNIFSKWWGSAAVVVAGAAMLASCNKELPQPTAIVPPTPSGQTMTQVLAANAKYSILRAAITRAGSNLTFNPSDPTAVYTLFAPDNDAFIASGIPNETAVSGLPAATVASIVNAHVIPGVELKAADLSTAFPNMYMQSGLVLSATPPVPYRMPVFPSRRTAGAWFNNIPVKAADIDASNGVIHDIARVFFPPSQVIAQVAAANPDLTYLMAALARADAGPPTGAPQLIPILSNAAANLTVFAPTNQAFQNLFAAMGLPTGISTISALPTQTVWGIVAFHVLGSRAYSVNLAAGNSTAASIMGVAQQINVTGANVTVRGPGNNLPTTPPTPYAAKVITADVNTINGVVHIVDAVLLPQ
ncbi:fasciclin domain-containing protein [Phnomibacter ginsenosidimutans]|uniref:FAS1 domain-containing protein n=1 Tax=Phnomibacter ginsenosidimutans TaxID=2676868 RepID=A0A6I6GVM2_9BACT|nr:fasciclin domain-containing protein [Phnomibacter ginsenosidimutans]QGW29159.1 hypothetical protein GLV81_14530 [Phnomibacter ginsenosidimutans]